MGEGDLGADFRIENMTETAVVRLVATGERSGGGMFQRTCVVTIDPPPRSVEQVDDPRGPSSVLC